MNGIARKLIITFLIVLLPVSLCAGGDDVIVIPEVLEEAETRSVYESLDLFIRVMELVNEKYVDQVERRDLIEGALQGMLGSLDDYSQFMAPDLYREMQVETRGEFGGIGIEITLREGVLTVISPIEGTPAIRAGILPGDRIVEIEGEPTKGISIFEAVRKLRGEPGDPVSIKVMRIGEAELLDFTIVRDIIRIESVKDIRMVNDRIGYIRITQFQEKTPGDFDRAMEQLLDKGMEALVVDLRWNPGGLLTSAITVADRFLKKGQLIVETRGRDDQVEMAARASGRGPYPRIPLAVLINEGSASGSEIVAGALRDNYRAVLVGSKTFGKGSVQSVLPLPDDSGLRLTTGRYYTAGKRAIQEEGVTPDVAVEMTTEEKREFFLRRHRELDELENQLRDNEDFRLEDYYDDPDEETRLDELDPQLRTAVDILKGILIQRFFEEEAGAGS